MSVVVFFLLLLSSQPVSGVIGLLRCLSLAEQLFWPLVSRLYVFFFFFFSPRLDGYA